MKSDKTLSLFIFIDAFGWDLVQGADFFTEKLPHRKPLKSVFGYSSTAVPTILTGRMPQEHGHFSFYYFQPEKSPFKPLRPLALIPKFISSRARVRNKLSQALKKLYGYSGYFQIYNMPFNYMHLFDYCEKKDLFASDGILAGDNAFSLARLTGTPMHVSDWRVGEERNHQALLEDIRAGQIRWAFNYNADLDGIMHIHGPDSDAARAKIAHYKTRLQEVFEAAEANYEQVDLYVFSDHCMAEVTDWHDLWGEVKRLPYRFGRDYAVVYDSTMARFWFMNDDARHGISALLKEQSYGKILSRDDLKTFGSVFPHNKYGELFFLLDEGHLIVPSFMGERPIAGMHGYHPDAPSSTAALMSNREIGTEIGHIADMYKLMVRPLKGKVGDAA